MANFKKPATKKGNVPKDQETNNLMAPPSDDLSKVDLNFKVDSAFRKDYKQLALDLDCSMVEILKASFEMYRKQVKRNV